MKEKQYPDLSVLIVEDEPSVRETLMDVLSHYFGSVYSASDGCEGLDLITKFNPDIVITDIQMPCLNGLDMMVEAKKITSNSDYIFTTAFNDREYLLEAINNRAYAYLMKPIKFEILFQKIKEIVLDKKIDNNSGTELLHKELSTREYEVFLDISKGIKPNNIAQKYDIKAKTVGTYRRRILEKMSLNSNSEIIRYALKNGLI